MKAIFILSLSMFSASAMADHLPPQANEQAYINSHKDNVNFVPAPSTFGLIGLGLGAVAFFSRKK